MKTCGPAFSALMPAAVSPAAPGIGLSVKPGSDLILRGGRSQAIQYQDSGGKTSRRPPWHAL